MREVVIRKEQYGIIVFNPNENAYYRVYDKKLSGLIEEQNYIKINKEYPNEYRQLLLDSENIRYIDNTILGENIFVPLEAYFDYTAVCNKSCSYCYNKKFLGNTTMPNEMVKKVFDSFSELGIMRVHLAGGEPTINYEGLKNYIEYGASKGMRISMATNGSFLNDDKICNLLTTNDLISVSISIDSANQEKNDYLRGRGTFDEILSGIKKLKEYREQNNDNLNICYKPVYYPKIEENEIKSLIELAISCKIDMIKFANPERCEDHEIGYYGKTRTDYYNAIKKIQNIIEANNYEIKITNATNPYLYDFIIGIEENRGCIGAQELITINPDGRITPCLMNHYLLGNIYNYNNLREFLIFSEELKKYKELIRSYSCGDCKIHTSCRGGCQVRKKVHYGEIKSIDPLCPKDIVKENHQSKVLIRKINVYHSL